MQSIRKWAAVAAGLCAMALAQGSAPSDGQPPVYKCGSRHAPTYTHVPCNGGRALGRQARQSDRYATPSQDRAKLVRRAGLAPEVRKQCEALDEDLRALEILVRARGDAVTPDEERPLVQGRLRYRQLRC